MFEPIILIAFIFILFIDAFYKINIWPMVAILFISLLSPMIIQIVNRVISKQNGEVSQRTFEKQIDGIKGSVIRGILEIATLPDKAYTLLDAIVKTFYRINISKIHLLEWTTAEEAEKKAKNSIKDYYMNMLPNVILGIVGILF